MNGGVTGTESTPGPSGSAALCLITQEWTRRKSLPTKRHVGRDFRRSPRRSVARAAGGRRGAVPTSAGGAGGARNVEPTPDGGGGRVSPGALGAGPCAPYRGACLHRTRHWSRQGKLETLGLGASP